MTRADIISMAQEAGIEIHERKQQARVGMDALLGIDSTDKLERFAALVAASEREACAKLLEKLEAGYGVMDQGLPKLEYMRMKQTAREHAAAIRTRTQS